MVMPLKIDFPGLISERMRSGAILWRVRVAGNAARRIRLTVTPDHPEFAEHYHAARAGIQLQATSAPITRTIPQSLAWLTYSFETHMQARVKAGQMDAGTLRQRAQFFTRLRADYGAKEMAIPTDKILEIRDNMAETPGAADNMVKAIRAMYTWAIERRLMDHNPAKGVARINQGTGAVPWSSADLRKFRDHHPRGTMAHLALTLFMFTACRRGDVIKLGPRDERRQPNGETRLLWQPGKKGSSPVHIPILPPLARAIAAQTVAHPAAYLLTDYGRPFASGDAFGNKFRDWTTAAGIINRSPHGIRKAAGNLLAEEGATQYQIMAVHGHTSPDASEVYTRGASRARLADDAMKLLANMDW